MSAAAPIARTISWVEETGSTNADLAAAIRAGDTGGIGAWHITRRQTAGKGRQGRAWHDGAGNFMGSTIVAVKAGDPPPSTLSFVAAIAVANAIEDAFDGALDAGSMPRLKWPNDVLLDGGKISGILLEMVGAHVIVGIGVNLVSAPQLPDRKTVCLRDFGDAPSLEDFAAILAAGFSATLAMWRMVGLEGVLRAFAAKSVHTAGSPVTVHDTDGSSVSGHFIGLDNSDGALRLRLADGAERVIRAGDIS